MKLQLLEMAEADDHGTIQKRYRCAALSRQWPSGGSNAEGCKEEGPKERAWGDYRSVECNDKERTQWWWPLAVRMQGCRRWLYFEELFVRDEEYHQLVFYCNNISGCVEPGNVPYLLFQDYVQAWRFMTFKGGPNYS
ncbi:hypothetical protein L1987_82548 [Smallanthus sonchifolius]|uniref:Uncharacterized protein n=1 Tax=Smallanthus sonchifolius TaxID=185202 RepID=A0ACB8YAP3_9ASTR|nr:hypothetical protein L1987_82548 [Smallanthus sonchifolius]